MELEHKIEKWLRAYAKRRRDQADASLKMHPATRRLLQDEIARNRPEPEKKCDTVSLWELVHRRWVYLLGFTACVVLLGVILLPLVHESKKREFSAEKYSTLSGAKKSMAEQEVVEVQAPLARQTSTVTAPAYSPSPTVTAESKEAPQPAPEAGSANVNSDVAPMAAGSSPPEPPPAPSTAPGEMALSDNPSAPLPAAAPAQPPPAPIGIPGSAPATLEETFASSASQSLDYQLPYSYKNSNRTKTPVLVTFQVLQNGNAIRIVDQDGSIYDGSLLAESANVEKSDAGSFALKNSTHNSAVGGGGFGGGGGAGPAVDSLQTASLPAAQNYLFQVMGTNRTLNQSVVFNGRLLANKIGTRRVEQALGATAISGGMVSNTNQAPPLSWASLRISGTATVNNTNRIEVNATSLPPVKQ